MFTGQYRHALDDKNRLFIPAKLRESVDGEKVGGFYMSTGMERTLFLFTEGGFADLRKSFSQFSFTNSRQREFQRMFFANTAFSELDAQGRILIPESLAGWALLKKDVAILGVENRIELWDAARWEAYRKKSGRRFERIADELFKPF